LLLHESFSSVSLLSNKSLNLWALVESLITLLKLSSDNVLGNSIGLSEGESSSDSIGSLWSKSSWSLLIGEASNVLLSLNENLKSDNSKIWSADASSNRLSLSLSGSSWSVSGSSLSHENSDSAVYQDTLFHGESLFVISSSNSEGVTFELFSYNFSVNIRPHSSIIEVAIDLVIVNVLDNLLTSRWI